MTDFHTSLDAALARHPAPERPPMLTIDVTGTPAPQGSKRAFVVNGHAVMTESSAKVKPWRQDVVAAVLNYLGQDYISIPGVGTIRGKDLQVPLTGPVRVDITFYLPRPRYHYRTGARAHELKDGAPTYVDKKPDKDKLERATCDALTTSGVIRDDSQIAAGFVEKRYADAATGARITITPLTAVAAAAPPPGETAATAQGALL